MPPCHLPRQNESSVTIAVWSFQFRTIEQEGKGSGLGAVAGGLAGALLGNQVGNGTGRDLATIAGAHWRCFRRQHGGEENQEDDGFMM